MALYQVAFSLDDQSGPIGSGLFSVQNQDDFVVVGITGTIRGSPIDGLSSYLNPDQRLTERIVFTRLYEFDVDANGLSFTANGVKYNINGAPGVQGQGAQSVNLLGSDGTSIGVSFNTAHTETLVCFASGTRIKTLSRYIEVEQLSVGDRVVTSTGDVQLISWIGQRTISHPFVNQWPVSIAAHAFGAGLPERELRLSPGHPVLVGADEEGEGGHLVPIMCLINGTTIERVPVDAVTYWHVELDEHDILLAEGLPAESYIDLGSRPWFGGADGALHDPDLALSAEPGRCRPVAIDGPIVEAERRRLDMVFATRLASAYAWPDEVSVRRIFHA